MKLASLSVEASPQMAYTSFWPSNEAGLIVNERSFKLPEPGASNFYDRSLIMVI